MDLKRLRKTRLERHPFYDWVNSDATPIAERLLFAPIMTPFVMNFRDMNKWFIRFPRPRNDFERIINGNTFEDETHSRLFLHDWRQLNLDNRLGWRASDTMWWLFLAEDTEPFRRFGARFARMTVVDDGDVLVRFAHSEAGEACGNAFFTRLAPIATALQAVTGRRYTYFGPHHLSREPGHVLQSPGVFENETLDPAQHEKAIVLANEMFDIFQEMHDCFLRYARRYVEPGQVPTRDPSKPLRAATVAPPPLGLHSEKTSEDQAAVQRVLLERKLRTARHPFYEWLRRETGRPSAKAKLQRFLPMWAMDILGYRDLNRYALRYDEPQLDQERAINQWVDALQTHSVLFLNDWQALGMDDVLGWGAHDTLSFLFLDRNTEVHRRNIASFLKLAFGHPNPLRRFWLLEALESSGHAFFENTKMLARTVERREGVTLDYLGDRHDLAHPVAAANDNDNATSMSFKQEPMNAEDRDVAIEMIDTVFNAVDEQLLLSLDVVMTNKFGIEDEPKRVAWQQPL